MRFALSLAITLACSVACGAKTGLTSDDGASKAGAPEPDASAPDAPCTWSDGPGCTFCGNQWYCPGQDMPLPNCPADVANGSSLDQACSGGACIACQNPDDYHVNNVAWIWTCATGSWQGETLNLYESYVSCTAP
jgi:hypothetical protein